MRFPGPHQTISTPSPGLISPRIQLRSPAAARSFATESASSAGGDDDHAHAHVEHPEHLIGRDPPTLLKDLEQQAAPPSSVGFDPSPEAGGGDPREIAGDSAAGDVGQAVDPISRSGGVEQRRA